MAKRFRFEPLGDLWLLIVTFNKDTWSDRGSLRCLTTPGAGAGQKLSLPQHEAKPKMKGPTYVTPITNWPRDFWDDLVVWYQNNNVLND